MRALPIVLLATALVACAPPGDDAPATDTAPATVAPTATAGAADSARDTSTARASAGIIVPAPASTPGSPARRTTLPSTSPAPRPARTDSAVAAPRIKPPTKAPGGYIMVPRSAHDSLRMAPPTSTATPPRP